VGKGNPIVFLHGNPTSSHLWRKISPHVQHLGRCIAPDMIGMSDSDPIPNSGPGTYTFREHQEYLFALFDTLGLGNAVTFVIHDWGSANGLYGQGAHLPRIRIPTPGRLNANMATYRHQCADRSASAAANAARLALHRGSP
jgi:haloalkane dehalogenase